MIAFIYTYTSETEGYQKMVHLLFHTYVTIQYFVKSVKWLWLDIVQNKWSLKRPIFPNTAWTKPPNRFTSYLCRNDHFSMVVCSSNFNIMPPVGTPQLGVKIWKQKLFEKFWFEAKLVFFWLIYREYSGLKHIMCTNLNEICPVGLAWQNKTHNGDSSPLPLTWFGTCHPHGIE